MKDSLFWDCEMSNGQKSTDYVLDYLNFDEFDVENSASSIASNNQDMLFNDLLSSQEDFLPNDNCHIYNNQSGLLTNGFDISYHQTKRTIQKPEIFQKEKYLAKLDLNPFTEQSSSSNILVLTKDSPVVKSKKQHQTRVKYLKRNCDLGVDTSADPMLKPAASGFTRTRGKLIKKQKNRLIKYTISSEKKLSNSQVSTKISEDSNCLSKKGSNLDSISTSYHSLKNIKPNKLSTTISDILNGDGLNAESMLMSFFTMKVANECYYRDATDDLLKLSENTRNIENLRASLKNFNKY